MESNMLENDVCSQKPFGPLNISETLDCQKTTADAPDDCQTCVCILCDMTFTLPIQQGAMLTHFYLKHRLVISDVHLIPNMKAYVEYWKKSFEGYDLGEFCTTMLLDQTPDGTYSKNEKYYLLSEVLPKDYELRNNLQKIKYQEVLDVYQMERTATDFCKECLFCRQVISGTRISFIIHLNDKHNLYLGKHSSLVYVEDLIKVLQSKIEQFICIYCQKIFKDRATLKEHMRKKNHKRINPKQKEFDRFYLINYSYFQKQTKDQNIPSGTCESVSQCKTDLENNSDNDDPDWCDWKGPLPDILCLFCKQKEAEFSAILEHMINVHSFDFTSAVLELEFYKKVKIVNYIRRKMYLNECVKCDEKFENTEQQQNHLRAENHTGIPDKKYWDHPEYFFPTFEDDNFLCYLDDDDDNCLAEDMALINL